jgi:uroporphyrinogen decarboxylase
MVKLTHRQRVLNCLAHRGYDRLPVRYMGEAVVTQALIERLGATDENDLLSRLGIDWRYVQPAYCGPAPRTFADGSRELVWPDRGWPVPTRYKDVSYSLGMYTEAVYRPFESIDDPAELAHVTFPTADWLDYAQIKTQCQRWDGYAIVTGTPGVLDFINGISHGRGIERVLLDLGTEDPVYLALLDKKFEYHYSAIERTLRAAGGLIDVVQTGDDLGTQLGLLIRPATFDKIMAARYRQFFDMVHRHGARVMLHSCGGVRGLLPRLIDLGLDILDVVQVSAAGMDIVGLQADFGHDLAFCGTMCVQTMLPKLTTEDVAEAVRQRRRLFADGGLILGPTHSIQPDTPLDNILSMYGEAGSLSEEITSWHQ